MRFLPLMLLVLFAAGPVTAQEAAPADPELAALEQECLDGILFGMSGNDLNYNGRCDPKEKALVLAASVSDSDLDNSLDIDPLELALAYLNTRQPLLFRENRKFHADYRRLHPGPFKGSELCPAIEEELALNSIAELAGISRLAGWRESLRERLAKEEDRNQNGVLDHDELVMRGAVDHALAVLFNREASKAGTVDSNLCDVFDRDGDRMLNKAEHDAAVEIVKEDFDLDGDGTVSLGELQLQVNLPADIQVALKYPFLSHIPIKEQYAAFTKQFLPVYDWNGDGRWQPLEMAYAVRTERELARCFYRINHPRHFSPEAREIFIRQLLAERDLNGNGKVDYAEITSYDGTDDARSGQDQLSRLVAGRIAIANPPVSTKTLLRFSRPPVSIKRLCQDPRLPAASLADCMKTLLALYDADHDGRLDNEEAWIGGKLDPLLRERYARSKHFPTLAEQQIWIIWIVMAYDKDQDRRLSPAETLQASAIEMLWLNTRGSESFHQLDKNGDDWLDFEERKPRIPEILKLHDINRNGILEEKELRAFVTEESTRLVFLSSRRQPPEDLADWDKNRSRFDFDQDGVLDLLQGIPDTSMLFVFVKSREKRYSESRNWYDFMVKNFDSNQDGRVDTDEIKEYENFSAQWRELAVSRQKPPVPAALPELQRWALENGDANHDGRLSLAELMFLNRYPRKMKQVNTEANKWLFELQKIGDPPSMMELNIIPAFTGLIHILEPLYPDLEKDERLALTPAGRLALAKQLLQMGDRNGNGRLDYEESYRLFRENLAKASAAREKRRLEAQLRREEEQKRQQEAEWRRKYDFNGNGQLDPEERIRAEADAKSGILAPAME